MIAARELAADCGVDVGDVLTALAAMHELTLGPDSGVREHAANLIRERFREPKPRRTGNTPTPGLGPDEQLQRLRDKLASNTGHPSTPTVNFSVTPSRRPRKKDRGWRPGDTPLPKVVKALADQIVEWNYAPKRPAGVIFAEELATARQRQTEWAKQCFEQGVLLSDEIIVGWVRAFPDMVLPPREVVRLAAAGLTPNGAKLRLWYGRCRDDRPMLLDQIRMGDISVEQAVADVMEYERGQGG
ncbi:hypothetical protein [Mycobacterium stomatepiae]|uniref:Uncharacterized protein n=1 Tax=Mycobacterium stomatepiae TaxID=470076 RepID=A0A7I7Q4M4_9MYCO|nr:hypothetical protein [Mycobacterium stomatepiae]MCV7163285.1 hypothetical protein [Mycobacterium stomatepiae]BBY21300.1 hypothetical protein MSTO_15050 [Mycobacterium stomatepiae]